LTHEVMVPETHFLYRAKNLMFQFMSEDLKFSFMHGLKYW